MTTKNGEELKTLYPITNNSENLFRSIFAKNNFAVENKINYLEKNYRTKCDFCSNLCDSMFCLKENYFLEENEEIENESLKQKDLLIICETCYTNENFPKDIDKEMFEVSNLGKLLYGIEGKEILHTLLLLYYYFILLRRNPISQKI